MEQGKLSRVDMTRKDQRIGKRTRESNKEKNMYGKKKRIFTV